MNTSRLQARLDQALATSLHRWVLMFTAISSIVLASGAIVRATPFTDTWVVYCVAVIALVVAIEPGEQLGLVLMGIVLFQWVTVDQGVTSPWSMALAISLYVFHASVALMAVTPHTASVDREILRTWMGRSVFVILATVGVWFLVAAFERREIPGNAALSALAFAVLAVAVVAFRSRSLPDLDPR